MNKKSIAPSFNGFKMPEKYREPTKNMIVLFDADNIPCVLYEELFKKYMCYSDKITIESFLIKTWEINDITVMSLEDFMHLRKLLIP